MWIHHVPTVSFVNLGSQNSVFDVLISCDGWFKATKKLSKLINSSARYQNSSDMRFLQAGRLYFNHDVFTIFLPKTRINFTCVNITYVYVTEFTLNEPT